MSAEPTAQPAAPAAEDSPATSPEARRVVLVAGSGRSGTSTLAGIFKELGLHVPTPEVIPDETNPKGFGESQWVVDLHDRLLERVHVQVSDARPDAWSETARLAARERLRKRLATWLEGQFAEADELVVKDPRLAWFLGLWRVASIRAGVEPGFVTMLRPPPEVIGSKRKYYNSRLGDAHGTAAWVNMMLNTERATRGSDRVFIRYHDLLSDWTTSVFHAGEALNLQHVQNATPEHMRRVHQFVDPSLRRVQLTWDDLSLPDRLRDVARASWEQLDKLAEPGGDTPEVRSTLDELREAYDALYEDAEAIARSSIVAARVTALASTAADLETDSDQQPVVEGDAVDRLAARTPHWLRATVPASARQAVRRRFGGGTR